MTREADGWRGEIVGGPAPCATIAEGSVAGFVAASIADVDRPGGRRRSPLVLAFAVRFLLRRAWLA